MSAHHAGYKVQKSFLFEKAALPTDNNSIRPIIIPAIQHLSQPDDEDEGRKGIRESYERIHRTGKTSQKTQRKMDRCCGQEC
jgi:hypothetical protein